MKIKWPALILLAVALAALFLPAVGLHVHSQLGEKTAALFPSSLRLWDILTAGNRALPVDQVPALGLIRMNRAPLLAGMLLLLAACVCAMIPRRGGHIALFLGALSLTMLGAGILQWMNLSGSLLYSVLIKVQAGMYIPLVAAVALIIFAAVETKGEKSPIRNDGLLRKMNAGLALAAVLMMLLPVYSVQLPATLTENPADAAATARTESLLQAALAQEGNLLSLVQEKQAFSNVLSGDLGALEPYSAAGTNIKGIFQIGSNNTVMNTALLAAGILLVLAFVLGVLPRVDRWFATGASVLATVLLVMNVLAVMTVGDADMYGSASRQLLHMGLGRVTAAPLLVTLVALGSALSGILGIRYANEPYFVNPVPAAFRMRLVALLLAALTLVCILMPNGEISFTKPNKNKVVTTAQFRGVDAVTFSVAEALKDPADSKGKAVYAGDDEEYPAEAVNAATERMAGQFTALTWVALALTLAGTVLLAMNKNRKPIMILFLAALAIRCVTWLTVSRGLPRAVGTSAGSMALFLSLPVLLFAAFFTYFKNESELPKKYKLFLMTLPFLVAVFLFSYLPLYGWSYAFYNYKFGIPMDQQEYVGFKWFAEMVTNPANRDSIFRVLKNTLGMSGINLATSWLPMIFAVFLNEITQTRFKKFVQIFTTLPNFISWALVFAFAMCLFAADTGIYSKLMFSLGLSDPANPTVWLNSGDHIWLKMWAWSTWKGLGWGAIMYLAAIAGIDQELYEAAEVDGANRWHRMRYITLPGLLPTFFVLLLLSISNILNNGMDQYLVFQNPMNRQTIEVLDLYVYNITLATRGTALYSYATAIGILKTVVSVTLLFTANFLSRKLRGESIM